MLSRDDLSDGFLVRLGDRFISTSQPNLVVRLLHNRIAALGRAESRLVWQMAYNCLINRLIISCGVIEIKV